MGVAHTLAVAANRLAQAGANPKLVKAVMELAEISTSRELAQDEAMTEILLLIKNRNVVSTKWIKDAIMKHSPWVIEESNNV